MGFSSQQYRKEGQERPWKINPAWRGIGCILFLLVPIMAWVGATMVLQSGIKLPLAQQMARVVVIPFTHIRQIDGVILQVNHYFQATKFMEGQLYVTILLLFIGYGILAFVYALMYKIAGPPRYGPFDVPPDAVKR